MNNPSHEKVLQDTNHILELYMREWDKCMKKFTGLETFTPQPTDVFIDSYMKSGTTLMQQMTYQILAAAGKVPSDPDGENFKDISEVVPFIEVRESINLYHSINPYSPNLWKSHAKANKFDYPDPSTGRFIYCVRNGLDVAESLLDFTLDWGLDIPVKGEALRAEVYRQWFMSVYLELEKNPDGIFERKDKHIARWFEHVRGWIDSKHEHTLFLVFEEIIKDIPATVRKVADFMCVPLTSEQVDRVVAKCARDKMAQDPRFRDSTISKLNGWNINLGKRVRPADARGFKHIQLPEECIKVYQDMFYDTFGVWTYEELVSIIHSRNAS